MTTSVAGAGALLAIIAGLMNGSFTLPMRFLGRWGWENVWSLFILVSCLVMPTILISVLAPRSWTVILQAPHPAVEIAILSGFAWGFGAIMFGQSVSAIGISLANTLVLAVSSALGSLLPILLLASYRLLLPEGHRILAGVAIETVGIGLCGRAGYLREKVSDHEPQRREMVGHARPLGIAILLAIGSGVLSAVFNVGFAFAQPIAQAGRAAGLGDFSSANLIWWIMLASGSISNLAFCAYLFRREGSFRKFRLAGSSRLFSLSALMGLLWGGSIFVYGAAAQRLGSLGVAIGWPLSLATGLILANAIGLGLGEWKGAPAHARTWLYSGVALLIAAVVVLGNSGT